VGKYSVKGSPAFDALVDEHMKQIADEVWTSSYSRHWKALVLLGGYGRGEGTPLTGKDGSEKPFNDYDLVVVTTRLDPLVRGALRHLEKRLTAQLGIPVDLYPYLKRDLPKCEFSLLNYEMKYGHKVIRGNEKILSRMPDYAPGAIPLSEGTRLLMNRGKLLLDMKRRLSTGQPLTPEERMRFIKFILKADLAFGDCALLMRNAYDISYSVKKERINTIDLHGIDDPGGLVKAYLEAVQFKENGNLNAYQTANIHLWLTETVERFLNVFLWYERRALNHKFRTVKKYARSFPNLGNEGSPLKNAVHNLRALGLCALPRLFVHPRIRLYPAIALLLDDNSDPADIRRLLCSRQQTFDGLCDDFLALQQRFS
jgi:predicted nucleotidyltransferase